MSDEHPSPPVGDGETQTHRPATPAAGLNRAIGRYRLKQVIASGGMGTVYEAIQEKPRRSVALKVLKRGVTSRAALRRFEYESQILARLRHPAIAAVFEAGRHEDVGGEVPYFAMEYVPGARTITAYAQEKGLTTRQRIELFIEVCEAVHHGHQKGIVHRDLKPSNILIDAGGQPKVIDFGVARATDSDMAVTTQQTAVGELVGTLQYMSPEQCEADPHNIDTRSDVYALGVVLYELLAGRLPYDLTEHSFFEAPRIIREVPPKRLSSIERSLSGDLEKIVGKALEKDRARRYQSADALKEDLERFLRYEPVAARPSGNLYRFARFVQRERKLVSLAAALVIAASAGLYFLYDARRTAAVIAHQQALKRATEEFLQTQLARDPGDRDAIIADCTAMIDKNPDLAFPYALRAKMRLGVATGRVSDALHVQAMRDVQKALSLDPANSLALRTLGVLHLFAGDFDEARDAFLQGMATAWTTHLRPEDFHNQATLWRLAGKYDEALNNHDKAVNAAPHVGVVYQQRGITRYFTGDVDGAIADWEKAAQVDPNSVIQSGFWIWEARMLRHADGDVEGAREALDSARDAAARHPLADAVWRHLAGQGTADVVVRAIDDTDPGDECQAYYAVGIRHRVDGNMQAAGKWFRRSRASNAYWLPEFELAGWHLERFGAQ